MMPRPIFSNENKMIFYEILIKLKHSDHLFCHIAHHIFKFILAINFLTF